MDEDEDDIFATLARATQPVAPVVSSVGDEPLLPDVPWPIAVVEAPRSQGEEIALSQESGEAAPPHLS